MRLLELEIRNLRGIRELTLKPGGGNLVVLGPNGAGKSAVVDAVDFLLTGSISRLSGKGTSGITLKQHGRHIGAKIKDASVRAVVRLDGAEIEISRWLANPEDLLVSPEAHRPQVEKVVRLAQLGHHVLTRREILRFVAAERGERAREIQALLNIQEIDRTRQAINAAAMANENELKARKREEEEAYRAVCRELGIEKYETQLAVGIANDRRAILGGEPISHGALQDVKRGLRPPESSTQTTGASVWRLEQQRSTLGVILGEEAIQKRIEQYDRLQEAMGRIRENPRLIEDLKALELIQIGVSLLEPSGRCPLCQAEHPAGYLHDFLSGRLRYAQEAQEIQAVIQDSRETLNQAAESVRTVLSDLQTAAEKAGLKAETAQLRGWMEQTAGFAAQAERERESYQLSRPREAYAVLDLPRNLHHELEQVFEALESHLPVTTPEQEAWDSLTRLEVQLQGLERASKALQLAHRRHAAAQKIKTAYEAARNQVLETLYHEVCERFAELYKTLHQEDESDFCAQLTPAGAGIDLRVEFHGHGAHPPHALHSEGHQDSMGVCLFLALAERLTQNKLDLIVLDDVVMSVDSGHRQQLGNMLARMFTHRQFLITTHDRVWATQLRNAGLVQSKGMVEFIGWDFDSGPLLSEISGMWDLIERDLGRGEVNAAAARLRRGLEEFAYHACDSLKARVRFTMDGRWELGDLLPAAMEQYKNLLKKAKNAANSWGKVELVERLMAHDEAVRAIFEERQELQWVINPSVHYSAWADVTAGELRAAATAHREMVRLFYCEVCGSMVTLDGGSVRCQCGEVSWNLREK